MAGVVFLVEHWQGIPNQVFELKNSTTDDKDGKIASCDIY